MSLNSGSGSGDERDSSKGTIELPIPMKPYLTGRTSQNSIKLSWEKGGDSCLVTHYTVKYWMEELGEGKRPRFFTLETDDANTTYEIRDLKPNAIYRFRVASNADEDQGKLSEVSGPIRTISTKVQDQGDLPKPNTPGAIYRRNLLKESTRVQSDKEIPIYQVPLSLKYSHEAEGIRLFEFGTKPALFKTPHKIILLVGATGAGKSTLINGFLNYVLGVEWEENSRFRLVEESSFLKDQYTSQTKFVSVYNLNHNEHFKSPYSLSIIDTPGFGDRGGIEKDRAITGYIQHLFSKEDYGIDHIDAVCLVAQSSLARLTATQSHIFDSILNIFGIDVKTNIYFLITFCDSQKPPVIESAKQADFPYNAYFKFNNSALFAKHTTDGNSFDKIFWAMGALSFQMFFAELAKIKPISLRLTKEVLHEREQIEVNVVGIQEDITMCLIKLDKYRTEMNVVKRHEADLERNKDFEYTVDEEKIKKEDLEPGQHVTNCLQCNRTCHYLCAYADDEDKIHCVAMNDEGFCTVCSGGCIWNLHKNMPYRMVIKSVQVTKTSSELKKRYQKAQGDKMNAEKLASEIFEEFETLEIKFLFMSTEIRRSLKRLSEIALRPNPLSTLEYIDLLIRSEEAEAKPGFLDRIRQLEGVKAQAKVLNQMMSDGYDPFANYRETLKLAKGKRGEHSFQEAADEFKRKRPDYQRHDLGIAQEDVLKYMASEEFEGVCRGTKQAPNAKRNQSFQMPSMVMKQMIPKNQHNESKKNDEQNGFCEIL